MIGDGGEGLSIGQQQRIAIARALYGDPFLVLLDEPSASLDGEGEAALQNAIKQLKLRRAIVIVVVHRRSALALCDKVLVLLNGQQRDFGPRDEVLRRMSAPAPDPRCRRQSQGRRRATEGRAAMSGDQRSAPDDPQAQPHRTWDRRHSGAGRRRLGRDGAIVRRRDRAPDSSWSNRTSRKCSIRPAASSGRSSSRKAAWWKKARSSSASTIPCRAPTSASSGHSSTS